MTDPIHPATEIPQPEPAAEAAARPWQKVAAEAARRAGWAMADGAAWVAGRVADGYRSIDPDVKRHVVQAPLVGLTHLAPRARPVEALADDGARPLIFVHGLAGHPGHFAFMRTWFRLGGRTRTYAIAFDDGVPTPTMAAELRAFVERVVSVNGLPADARVDLVAHSMGGLVARYALLESAFAGRVATLVTLGTPHGGTHMARLASTPKTLDLRVGSEVSGAIATQLPWQRTAGLPRLVCLWSDADILISPPESATVDGAENVACHGTTHLGFLLSPRVAQRVWGALSTAAE